MSYAAVTAEYTPPNNATPDPALLQTARPHRDIVADDAAKVNVVSPDFKVHPATVTSETDILVEDASSDETDPGAAPGAPKKARKSRKNKAKRELRKAEDEGLYLWELAKEQILRPGVAGGLVGVVNVGLLAGASYAFYTHPHLRSDKQAIGGTLAAALVLSGVEGYAVERFRETPYGQEEERRAKQEGALLYRHAREAVLRPGVLGGLVGVVNLGVLGTVGYFAYSNWDRPTWDRRTVSAVSVGLLTLWGGEGYVAELYREGKVKPPRA